MNESILNALMRLFAIVANVDEEGLSEQARQVVLNYLELQLNQELAAKYIVLFDNYLLEQHKKKQKSIRKTRKRISLNSVKVLTICNEINEELEQSEKVIVLLRLLEFIYQDEINDDEIDFVKTVADVFNIPRAEFDDIFAFLIKAPEDVASQDKLLLINNTQNKRKYNHIYEENIDGVIQMLYLESINKIIVQYIGSDMLKLNNFNLIHNQTFIFNTGSVIKGPKIHPIYYTEIFSIFKKFEEKDKITFVAQNIEYTFPNSTNGIKPLSINEQSGRLIGIMGGSGAGKSTLLNILIGNIKIKKGTVKINGYDLYKDNKLLDGIIGFVPQDDLLIDELTVFQNLYFNAQLCFRGLTKQELYEAVDKVLHELDLFEIKNLTVGNPLNKFISGGQRKRLNIALELIREPSILFADEPTSGLSSADSDIVMTLLKELTYKGKLVFVNIHQPSSEIYKLFDKLIFIDKGGHTIFYGNPLDAVVYFRENNNIANADEAICPTCGNVNPEQVLELIENKVVDEFGKLTEKRKISPKKWYEKFKKHQKNNVSTKNKEKIKLPEIKFKKARNWQQFKIFSLRNILRKISNIQYIILNIIEAPLLAFILTIFSKYIKGTAEDPSKYIFAENVNIPSFMFMAVTVALFIGLTVSAEEIIKDRRILKREKFLNLSNWAYLNSKIAFLIALSALQTFLFVIISNTILEINGLLFKFWIILFSTAVWANLVGLIISSSMNSVVNIYITIPLILIPQLLFSGTVIDFTKLYKPFAGDKYAPIIGDVMISRWAYEALMVTQFSDNQYNKHFFDNDKKFENANYYSTSYYDKLEEIIRFLENHRNDNKNTEYINRRFNILNTEIKNIEKRTQHKFQLTNKLNKNEFDKNVANQTIDYIYNQVKKPNLKIVNNTRYKKDSILHSLQNKYQDKQKVIDLKLENQNKKVEDFVTNKMELENIIEADNQLVRRYRPIYQVPMSNFGRAQFYAAEKKFFSKKIKTIWVNVTFIWIFSIIMYIMLVTQLFDINSSPLRKRKY